MAMKESVGSLRAYFLLAGVISTLGSLGEIRTLVTLSVPAELALPLWALALISLGLGVGFVVAGVRLQRELLTGAGWIRKLLLVCLAMLSLELVLMLALLEGQLESWQIGWTVIHMAIAVYLMVNVKRLSDEAIAAQGVPPARQV